MHNPEENELEAAAVGSAVGILISQMLYTADVLAKYTCPTGLRDMARGVASFPGDEQMGRAATLMAVADFAEALDTIEAGLERLYGEDV